MIALALNNIKKFYGANQVLENVTFEIQEGEKAGIVGKNGCGKSTVLKLILGIEEEYIGSISIKKGSKLGYVDQIPDYDETYKVIDVLNRAFEVQHSIYEKMRAIELQMTLLTGTELDKILKKYSDYQKKYEQLGGYEIEERLSKVCAGLNITKDFTERSFSTLSGGEKTLVLLAKLLLDNPDILLLDEPSNHLDLNAIEWLEDFIRSYKGTVLIVSHDRYFLDRTVNKVIELEEMCSKTYLGNYSDYLEQKEKDIMLQMDAYSNQQKKIEAIEKAIKNLRDWGNRGDNEKFFKRAANMQKRLDKMDRVDRPNSGNGGIRLNLNMSGRSGKDVIILDEGFKSFGEKTILKNAKMHMRYGEKLALIGSNGCGKSTLLKLIMNKAQNLEEYLLDQGSLDTGAALKIGYLPQNVYFNNEEHTILESFRDDIEITEGKAREYLAKFLFYGESVFRKVKNLSGGERSRLVLAKLMFDDINLLILDEPTNHLDIVSRESLEETLKDFEGSIFFVSHDRYFINVLCSRVMELKDGQLTAYEGNYEYYRYKSREKAMIPEIIPKKSYVNYKPQREPKKDVDLQQNQKNTLEKELEALEAQLKQIENEMNYCNDHMRLKELYDIKESLSIHIDELMDTWINL